MQQPEISIHPLIGRLRCTGFFCLAIIKGPPNDIYCIIEEPSKHYFTEKVSYSRLDIYESISQTHRSLTDI